MTPSFDRIGPALPTSPVVLSVPHAGRDYPQALADRLRVPLVQLRPLEDRHVDTLALAARADEVAIVARRPRAWIDLNRSERDRDPRVDLGAARFGTLQLSTRVRGGLGLIPRRAAAGTEIWARPWSADDVAARIHGDHRPYHAAVADALAAARARFGIAVLLDVHSMPPLPGVAPARIVIGDRFGRTAAARFVGRIEGCARRAGLVVALNTPYAGGHILERHAEPGRDIHAVQLEIDRTLYLDDALDAPGGQFDAVARFVRDVIDALADEAQPAGLAAE
ncbi:N-formylglutamate amidohydrolase [uncultured Sphingomonas sp.]|uniref:N-formylglutamate amidohydrolase n=1 Tax=uncultured Sphingomonas sp. TaxID=158754 RepID=UPI0025DA2CE4|nr:N-formylglutamate amidohydrolase [uncultured Sphingomonas sp.]